MTLFVSIGKVWLYTSNPSQIGTGFGGWVRGMFSGSGFGMASLSQQGVGIPPSYLICMLFNVTPAGHLSNLKLVIASQFLDFFI